MSAVVVPAIMAFPSPIVGCLHGNSLESWWGGIFRTHAIGQVHCRGSQVVDHQHSTSSLLPPRECLGFLHARMDRRRLNAELGLHTWQSTFDKNPVAGLCVFAGVGRWRTFCFGRRLSVDDFVIVTLTSLARAIVAPLLAAYRGAAVG